MDGLEPGDVQHELRGLIEYTGWGLVWIARGPYDTVTSSMSGTLRDVNGDGGGALNVTHYPTIGLTSKFGLGLGSSCSILGTYPANTVHSCGGYGPVTDGVSSGVNPALGFVFDSSLVAGDFITYSGRITLENADAGAVPEPSTNVMMVVAAGWLAAWRFRRRAVGPRE